MGFLHVVQPDRDSTMDVSLIHAKIAKVLEYTKLVRGVNMYGVKVQLHIHQAIYLDNVGGVVTTNSTIVQKIKRIELIKLQSIGG